MPYRPRILLPAALLGLSECKKKDAPNPEAQLPPATQTGANTFGCLVNGQAWLPYGIASFSIYYDLTYRNGTINIGANRPTGSGSSDYQSLWPPTV